MTIVTTNMQNLQKRVNLSSKKPEKLRIHHQNLDISPSHPETWRGFQSQNLLRYLLKRLGCSDIFWKNFKSFNAYGIFKLSNAVE